MGTASTDATQPAQGQEQNNEQRHEDVAHALLHARARLDHGAVELAKRVGSPALRRHVAARLAGDREARLDGQRARDDAEAAARAGELRRLAARC